MAGNKAGGKKAAAKNIANNPNFYREIGRKGGSKIGILKGFALSHERAVAAGRKGGSISRRGPSKKKSNTKIKE